MDLNTSTSKGSLDTPTMELLTYARMAHTLQTAAIAALVFALFTYAPKIKQRIQLAKLPAFAGAEGGTKGYLNSAKQLYHDGYQKFKDSVYHVTTSDGEASIVIPYSLLPELRKLPDDVLSFPRAVERIMETKYTGLETESEVSVHSIKADLTPALSRLNATIADEVEASMRQHLPPSDEWTEVNINSKLVDIVTRVSGRIFVGPELCQDPEYLHCGSNYTLRIMDAVNAIKKMSPWLRPFLANRLPELKTLRAMEERAAQLLEPVVRERLEAEKNDPNWTKPEDMLQWVISRHAAEGVPISAEKMAKIQLTFIFAAVHTTTMTATNIIYTLATTPEYIQPLREEIRAVMAENDGTITSRALQQMVKLDSYMKEVTRLYPPGLTAFTRRVLKGFTLSNGQHIPTGVLIEVPSAAIYSDPTLYPSAATFDGFRHAKLREGGSATDHARNQFVTTNEANLVFGYGRHACPGRFFATNEIKQVLCRLILEYEVGMPEGRTERWEQLEIGTQCMPHPFKTVMLRRAEL